MIRAVPGPMAIPRAVWFVLVAAAINLYIIAAGLLRLMAHPFDWFVWEEAVAQLADGTLYEPHGDYAFVWSPVAAWLLALIVPLGVQAWQVAHVAALALLRDWWIVGLALFALPFWIDTMIGNTVVFVAVAGVLGLRGSRWGALVYLALCLLMPRPLQLPLALWILWKQPDTRPWFAAMAVASLVLVAWSGYGPAWIEALTRFAGGGLLSSPANLGPTRFLGSLWLILGVPLAAWLTIKGRLGLAGLAISPTVLPMYPLVLLWELVERSSTSGTALVGSGSDASTRNDPGTGSISELVKSSRPGSSNGGVESASMRMTSAPPRSVGRTGRRWCHMRDRRLG